MKSTKTNINSAQLRSLSISWPPRSGKRLSMQQQVQKICDHNLDLTLKQITPHVLGIKCNTSTDFDDEDFDDEDFQCCDDCDLPDACRDFGCAIKQGIKDSQDL